MSSVTLLSHPLIPYPILLPHSPTNLPSIFPSMIAYQCAYQQQQATGPPYMPPYMPPYNHQWPPHFLYISLYIVFHREKYVHQQQAAAKKRILPKSLQSICLYVYISVLSISVYLYICISVYLYICIVYICISVLSISVLSISVYLVCLYICCMIPCQKPKHLPTAYHSSSASSGTLSIYISFSGFSECTYLPPIESN